MNDQKLLDIVPFSALSLRLIISHVPWTRSVNNALSK